eukprot:2107318-Rhodomonas_salina.1
MSMLTHANRSAGWQHPQPHSLKVAQRTIGWTRRPIGKIPPRMTAIPGQRVVKATGRWETTITTGLTRFWAGRASGGAMCMMITLILLGTKKTQKPTTICFKKSGYLLQRCLSLGERRMVAHTRRLAVALSTLTVALLVVVFHIGGDTREEELEQWQSLVAVEPNGDVIEMNPPSWREWARKQADGPAPEFDNFEVDPTGKTVVAIEPNGDRIEMVSLTHSKASSIFGEAHCDNVGLPQSPPNWRDWLRKTEKDGAEQELENFQVRPTGKGVVALEPNGDEIE